MRRPGWRNPIISGFMGMRGVVSLASALSVPLLLPSGQVFPYRNLILFITFVVIIVTVVGQGLLLPWVIKKVKPQFVPDEKTDDQQIEEIELQLYKSALEKISKKYHCDVEENVFLKNKHELYKVKVDLLAKKAGEMAPNEMPKELHGRFKKIMMDIIEHERRELHAFRKKDGYDDDVIRIIENRLDLEEERIDEESEVE
jgi:CPA1 family monovalent cation:H+ antiporter